eukprot:3848201-Pleurochrysis_carterae.AAC.1
MRGCGDVLRNDCESAVAPCCGVEPASVRSAARAREHVRVSAERVRARGARGPPGSPWCRRR